MESGADKSVNIDSDSGYLRDYLDFDIRQLRDKLKDLEIALLRSGGTRRQLSSEEQTVQDFGRSLFEATLVGKVSTCYYRSMDQLERRRSRGEDRQATSSGGE